MCVLSYYTYAKTKTGRARYFRPHPLTFLSFRTATGALPTRHCEGVSCRDAGIACGRAESLGVDSLGPWVEGRGRVIDPRPLGAHVGRVLRLCGLLQGTVVRRTTRHGGTGPK